MAKIKSSLSFKNAHLTFEEDGTILLEEITKDDSKTYDLISELRKFANIDGVSLVISNDNEVEAIN